MLSNLEDSQYDDDNSDEVRESLVTKSQNMIQQIINDAKGLQTTPHARDASEPLQHKQHIRVGMAQQQS